MKLPEYIMSTPRLICVIFTFVSCYLAIVGKMSPEVFVSIVTGAFGYLFGSRGSENNLPKDTIQTTTTKTTSDTAVAP